MKPSFHTRLINGPFEDPGLYIRLLWEGRALMFDLGHTNSLSTRDILKITDIFVSHTHVDHFIGFDNVLRISLKKEGPLRFYGPEGFIDHVEGKLSGYTWNLTRDYPLVIDVYEVTEGYIEHAVFKAGNRFRREPMGKRPSNGILLHDSFCKVSVKILDHQIPCLAFSLEEECHININKEMLTNMGLPVGSWLSELKKAVRGNKFDAVIAVEGRDLMFSDLREVVDISHGQKLSYVVDSLGSDENIKKTVELVKGSDLLYIETYFLESDKEKARERYHLTAGEAGRIAREAGVGRMEPLHFSKRYSDDPEALHREAEEEFNGK
jgi:ribonuclease Z